MGNSDNTNNQVKVEIPDTGPVKITGNFIIKDLKRNTEEILSEVRLCRCGKSSNKPFCDESHKR
jgi:CDGSH-type Zn-finger protein